MNLTRTQSTHNDSTSFQANTQDLPPTYDAAVTSEVHCECSHLRIISGSHLFSRIASGPFVPAGTGDVKDVKVPMPTPDANASSPGAGPTPFSPPSMPPTTVYNYVNPVTHEVVTSLLPPDHPRMVCLQQGHDPHSKFGFLGKFPPHRYETFLMLPFVGIFAAVFWFPLGIGLCLLDRKVQCNRCGQVIDPGVCG